MYLIFDTETTGKADFKAKYDHPSQPRCVQIAGQLLDTKFKLLSEFNFIIKPEGFSIPKEASDIHGITDEIALSEGLDGSDVFNHFISLTKLAKTVVAHNIKFDKLIVEVELFQRNINANFTGDYYCTMNQMTPICQLPGKFGFKWPSLTEAYKHCFGKVFEGEAHNALIDVRACVEIFKWLKTKE